MVPAFYANIVCFTRICDRRSFFIVVPVTYFIVLSSIFYEYIIS